MSAIVVLGMHGSGTSLVSSMLRAMGVHMGDDFMGPVKGYETWEDKDFVRMNAKILASIGGDWSHPPTFERVIALQGDDIMDEVKVLVERKTQSDPWGWKDPRSCLTVSLYHPFLVDPHYVVITRDRREVAQSILSRGILSRSEGYWKLLSSLYQSYVRWFLAEVDSPRMVLDFESVRYEKAAVQRLADFVGVSDVDAALNTIKRT